MSSKRKGGGKGGGKKSGSYEVGYAKPPEHGKFKPGVSGNPQGRPRGAPNRNSLQVEQSRLCNIINEEAERVVTIQTADGKTKKITTTQALIRAINLNGIKGQQRAQRHAIELISETQRIAQAERVETFARWAKYKDDWSRGDPVAREAALPHPDHVKLDTDTLTVTIAGPRVHDDPFDDLKLGRGFLELAGRLRQPEERRLASAVALHRANHEASEDRFGLGDLLRHLAFAQGNLFAQYSVKQRFQVLRALCAAGRIAGLPRLVARVQGRAAVAHRIVRAVLFAVVCFHDGARREQFPANTNLRLQASGRITNDCADVRSAAINMKTRMPIVICSAQPGLGREGTVLAGS